ncbi:MAG: hypothetical protein H6R17_1935 [Proteobacteria bacterium]|nr:hypothetical protein [Pseudomonadota bacterium]
MVEHQNPEKNTTTTPAPPFRYESTGISIRFTDGRDRKPRSRDAFNGHRPDTGRDGLPRATA